MIIGVLEAAGDLLQGWRACARDSEWPQQPHSHEVPLMHLQDVGFLWVKDAADMPSPPRSLHRNGRGETAQHDHGFQHVGAWRHPLHKLSAVRSSAVVIKGLGDSAACAQ